MVAYADDIALVIGSDLLDQFRAKVRRALDLIGAWSERSGVRVNVSKCSYTWIGKRSIRRSTLRYESELVPEARHVKYLGVYIQSDLKWNRQTEYLSEKNSNLVGLMRRINKMVGGMKLKHRMTLYNQLYLSTMLYCSDVWGNSLNPTQRDTVHSLQRNAVLALAGAYPSTNNVKLLNLLGILGLADEITLRQQTRELDAAERKLKRREMVARRSLNGAYGGGFLPNMDLNETTSKEIFHFVTGHGPFVSHSRRFNPELPEQCRFCGVFEESPEHLLFYCAAFPGLEPHQELDSQILEKKC